MDPSSLITKYDRRLPRYTSYPTAPHFTPAVDEAVYRGWLAALPDDAALSVYLHVPFCAELCWYCGCHTTVVHRREPLDAYADVLLAEIGTVAAAIGRRLKVNHVHWGGGTPHALPSERLLGIMARLREAFAFSSGAEIAMELDPRTVDADTLAMLGELGLTRASLGVQDFDPVVQHAVHRIQPLEQTREVVAGLRRLGVKSINLDLMYGLPHQTAAGVAAAARQAVALRPERVAVFGYAHVPWMMRHQAQIPESSLPGQVERLEQRAAAETALVEAGYVAIGLDHYARPEDEMAHALAAGRLHRNFQGYTTDEAPVLVGLGASAIGSLPQGYAQNVTPVPEYRDRVRAGRLPVARGVALTAEDELRRDAIEQVMCSGRLDLDAVSARHGAAPALLRQAVPALEAMAADGLVRWDGHVVELRTEARPFLRAVAATFDAYWRPDETRHARAV